MLRRRFSSAKRQHKLRKQKAFAYRQRRLRFEGLEDRRVLAAFTWDGNSDGDGNGTSWNDPLNWTADAGFPNGTADTATFGNAGVGSVNVNGPFTVAALALNNTAGSYVFGGAAGNSLTIDDGAGGGSLSQSANVPNLFQVVGVVIPNPTAVNIAAGTLLINSIGVPGTEISGAGSIVKAGAGGLGLAGGNTFLGGVVVNAGTLVVANVVGSGTGTGNVTVNNAAILGGDGIIGGPVTLTGTSKLSPGGDLALGNLKIGAAQTVELTINGTTPVTQHDQLVVTGTVDVTGATLSLDGAFVPNPALLQSIVIVSNDGADAITGTFAGLSEGAAIAGPGGGTLFITYRGGDGNDIALNTQAIINGTAGNDTFAISGVGTTYTVLVNGVPTVLNNPPSLTINGLDGSDTLTVNYGGGATGPAGGIAFHGGTGAADNDKLVITGGTFASATHTFTTTGPEMSGSIVYNNGVNLPAITYDGLEPIDMTGSTITDLILNLPGTADLPILEDDGTAANGISQLRSGAGTFDTTTFANTISTLTINLGGDAAAMTVAALPDFTRSLTINGQAGADTVNFTGAASFPAITVIVGGAITDTATANLNVNGSADFRGSSVSIGAGTANFALLTFNSPGSVAISEDSLTLLFGNNAAGTLDLQSAGPITKTGPVNISVTGLADLKATSISLDLPNIGAIDFGTLTFDSAGAVAIREDSATSIVGVNTAASLDLDSTGAISDAGATSVTVTGLADFSATSISLGGGTANFGTLTFNSAGAVAISEDSAINIVGVNTAGSLDLDSTGAISDAGATSVTVTGLADFNGTSISLGGGTANFGTLTFNSAGAVAISEDSATNIVGVNTAGNLDLDSTGIISDAAATSVTVTGLADFNGASISLGGGTVNFGSLTFNSAGAVGITEDSDTVLSAASTAQSLTLSSAGSITDAAGASVTVTTTSSMSGTTAISLADNATDVLSIGGNASLSGSSITIAAPGTANFGSLTFNSAGAVGITEDSDTVLSGTGTAQSLTLSSAGSITDAAGASVTVTNNSSMSAAAAVSLTDNATDLLSVGGNASFSGSSITVAAPGTANFGSLTFNSAGIVGVTEDSDTVLSGTSTANALTLSSAGPITDAAGASVTVTNNSSMSAAAAVSLTDNATDVLNVGGNASFSGTSITVAAPGTANFGSLTFNSTGAVSITEDSDTVLSGTSTAQSLTFNSAGSIADAAGSSVTVTNNSSMSAAAAVSLTDNATDLLSVGGNASFSGTSITVAAPGTANFGSLTFNSPGAVGITEDSDTVLSGISTAQSLTLSSAGSITDAAGASVTVTNSSSMSATTTISLTDNATDVLNVGGNASFSGSSITVAAPGTANFGSLTFNSIGAVGITEDSDTILSGTSTAQSLTLNSAGSITDAPGASVTVTNNSSMSATTTISLTDNATDLLSVGGNASFSGSSITVAAPGTANFGSLTFNSAGVVGITEDSSTSIVGASTASDATVISAGDMTVSGSINATGNIALRAAGNVAIQASAALTADSAVANTITLAVDNGNPNAAPKTIDIDNAATLTTNITSLTSGGVFLVGGDDNDTFIFQPRSTTRFVVTGNAPAFGTLPGDRLSIDLSPPAIANGNATLTLGTPAGAGTFTFGSESERPVEYTGIEDINAVGGQYHLVLDMVVSGFQNAAADTVNAAVSAANLNLAVNAALFFADDVASLLSLSILGSSDVDQVNVNAISVLTSIDGRDNNDVITIASTGAVTTASGGAGDDQLILLQASNPVTLQGQDGEDTFTLGNGTLASLTVVPNIIGGELVESTTRPVREGGIAAGTAPFFRPHIVAKSIADKLILNDQTSTADAAFSIFGGSVNKNGANVATYSQIEILRLNAGSGNDDIAAFMDFGALPNIVQVSSGNNAFTENRLQVEGTSSGDNISIGDLNDATEATAPHRAAFELLDVKRAWVRGLGGNDTIDNISKAIGLFDGGTGDDFINFVSATPLPSKYNPSAKPKVAQNVSIVLGNVGKDFLFAGAGDGGNLRGSGGQDLGPYSDLGRVILLGDHALNAGNKLVAVNGGKGQKGDFYHFSSSAPKHSFVAFGDNQASAVKGNNFIAPTFDKIKFSSTIAWLKVQLFVGAGQIRSIVNLLNTQVAQHVKAPATPPKTPITSPLAIPLPAAPPAGEGESLLESNDYHNALEAGDVDGDGYVSPLDAALIINDLNARGSRKLSSLGEGESESLNFLDVDGDTYVSPLDAVLVINALNAAPAAASSALEDDELLGLLASDQAA